MSQWATNTCPHDGREEANASSGVLGAGTRNGSRIAGVGGPSPTNRMLLVSLGGAITFILLISAEIGPVGSLLGGGGRGGGAAGGGVLMSSLIDPREEE